MKMSFHEIRSVQIKVKRERNGFTYQSHIHNFLRKFISDAGGSDESIGSGYRKIKVQDSKDEHFHADYLALRVCIISDVHKFRDIRWINFFVFAASRRRNEIKSSNVNGFALTPR